MTRSTDGGEAVHTQVDGENSREANKSDLPTTPETGLVEELREGVRWHPGDNDVDVYGTEDLLDLAASEIDRLTFLLAVMAACAEGLVHLRDQGGVDDTLTPTLADYRHVAEAAHKEHRRALSLEGQVDGLKRALEEIAEHDRDLGNEAELSMRSIARAALASLPQQNQAPDELVEAVLGIVKPQGDQGASLAESAAVGSLPALPQTPLADGNWTAWTPADEPPVSGSTLVDIRLASPSLEATIHIAQRADEWLWDAGADPIIVAWRLFNPAENAVSDGALSRQGNPATDDHPSPPQTPVPGDER